MPRKHLTHDISIHALREEGDVEIILPQIVQKEFLSTPSARRATCGGLAFAAINDKISIHALREEGDAQRDADGRRESNFYPRPPRGGRPQTHGRKAPPEYNFYPRPPRGGRPFQSGHTAGQRTNFYPRPPRGGRRQRAGLGVHLIAISIHALREEGDGHSR